MRDRHESHHIVLYTRHSFLPSIALCCPSVQERRKTVDPETKKRKKEPIGARTGPPPGGYQQLTSSWSIKKRGGGKLFGSVGWGSRSSWIARALITHLVSPPSAAFKRVCVRFDYLKLKSLIPLECHHGISFGSSRAIRKKRIPQGTLRVRRNPISVLYI